MENMLTLGLVQMSIATGDVERNRSTAERMTIEAAQRGAQLIALPEFFLTAGAANPKKNVAETIPGPSTEHFGALAKRLGIHLIMGSIVERDSQDGNLYNTSALIDDHGSVLGKYRKRHLWCSEIGQITPANKPAVISTPWGGVGLLICWDLAFPYLAQEEARAGARLIVCCAHWQANDRYGPHDPFGRVGKQIPDDDYAEERFVDVCSGARAWENGVVFAFVNPWGDTTQPGYKPNRRIGHCQIHAPFHGLVGMAEDCETVLVRTVDLSVCETAERAYGLRKPGW
jgi:predicted amidohydrolase